MEKSKFTTESHNLPQGEVGDLCGKSQKTFIPNCEIIVGQPVIIGFITVLITEECIFESGFQMQRKFQPLNQTFVKG